MRHTVCLNFLRRHLVNAAARYYFGNSRRGAVFQAIVLQMPHPERMFVFDIKNYLTQKLGRIGVTVVKVLGHDLRDN